MRITLGYSPCPNDTFIFDALVHGRIDTEGLEFDVRLGDVEVLNRLAFAGALDVTKLSYHAFGHLTETYALLNAGSALGRGVGPLLVTADRGLAEAYQARSRDPLSLVGITDNIRNYARPQVRGNGIKEQRGEEVKERGGEEVKEQRGEGVKERGPKGIALPQDAPIAIPGKFTTANYLLGLAFPELANKQEVLFSDIEARVLSGEFTAGLLIHENRFTYHERGLHRVMDLGEFWEGNTGFAIPLGGIVIKRTLPPQVQRTFDRVLARSVQYAFDHPEASADYVAAHAQEMDPEVRRKHIDLYVNKYSLDLGPEGRAAVEGFLAQGRERGVIPAGAEDVFVGLAHPFEP